MRTLFWAFLAMLGFVVESTSAAEPVTLQLKWRHQFQFAGYYAALEKGYYHEAGLDVRILEGGPTIDVSTQMEQGKAHFAVGSSALLLDRQAGRDFVSLAVIFQHSSAVLVTLRRSGLRTIDDLAGKRLMDAPASQEIAAMLKKYGIDYAALPRVKHTGDPHDLLDGKADMMVAYSTNEPFIFEQQGEPYNIFTPRAAGIDLYGDNLFTTGTLIRTRPELVSVFRAATLRGWRYALENRAEIADLIKNKYGTFKSRDALMFEADQIAVLIQADLVDLGYQSDARWQHIAEVFASQGMLLPQMDIRGALYRPETKTMDQRLIWVAVGLALLAIIMALATTSFLRLSRRLRRQVAESQAVQAELRRSEAIKGHVARLASELQSLTSKANSLEALARHFLSFTAPLIHAHVGAVFVLEPGGAVLRFAGGHAALLHKDWTCPVGQGLIGQCAQTRAPLRLVAPSKAELTLRLGQADLQPAEILILPILYSGALLGVVELVALGEIAAEAQDLLDELLPVLAITLHVLSRNLLTEARLHEARTQQLGLREAGSRCRSVIEALADGVLVTDLTGTILLSNPRFEAMFGYDAGELAGRRVEALLPGLALRPGRERRQGVRKDGRTLVTDVGVSNMAPADGDPPGLCVCVHDVTEAMGLGPDGGMR